MPISTRLMVQSTIVLLAIGLAALVIVVGMTSWLNERAQLYFDDVIEARDTRGAAVELRAALQAAEASQRGFLLTGNEIYLAPYGTARALAEDQVEKVKQALSRYPGQEPLIERLSAVVREKLLEFDSTIALKTAMKDDEALAVVRTNHGKALMDEANVFLSGVIRAADERLTDGVNEQRRNTIRLRWASILAARGDHRRRRRRRDGRRPVHARDPPGARRGATRQCRPRDARCPANRGTGTGARARRIASRRDEPPRRQQPADGRFAGEPAGERGDRSGREKSVGRDAGTHLRRRYDPYPALYLPRRRDGGARRIPVDAPRPPRHLDAGRRPWCVGDLWPRRRSAFPRMPASAWASS